jgi:hypothetical protein
MALKGHYSGTNFSICLRRDAYLRYTEGPQLKVESRVIGRILEWVILGMFNKNSSSTSSLPVTMF